MQLQWLKCAEDDDVPAASYVFDSSTITLQHQGCNRNESITIDTRKCMKYLVELADPQEMLKDNLVSEQRELWWKMIFADKVVNLFDALTWDGVDYEPLANHVHKKIGPHALH